MAGLSISKEVYVDIEINYDEFSVSELATALINQPNWQKSLDTALSLKKSNNKMDEEYSSIKELVETFSRGLDTSIIIREIAYENFGRVL